MGNWCVTELDVSSVQIAKRRSLRELPLLSGQESYNADVGDSSPPAHHMA